MKTRTKKKKVICIELIFNHYGVALYQDSTFIPPPHPFCPVGPHDFFGFLPLKEVFMNCFTRDFAQISRAKSRQHLNRSVSYFNDKKAGKKVE